MLFGLTNSIFDIPLRCSAFCPSLTFTIEQQNKFYTLGLRSAAVAGGDEWMKSPTAQMPERWLQLFQPSMKKVRTRTGDVFKIPVDEKTVCYGQVMENNNGVLRITTFDGLYDIEETPTIDRILSDKIVLLTDTMDAKIYHGHWKIYGNTHVKHELPKPYFKIGSDPTYITDYKGTKQRAATPEEENQFDFKFSVAPIRIQNAMQAFFKVKNWEKDFDKLTYDYCVEKSRIKP